MLVAASSQHSNSSSKYSDSCSQHSDTSKHANILIALYSQHSIFPANILIVVASIVIVPVILMGIAVMIEWTATFQLI